MKRNRWMGYLLVLVLLLGLMAGCGQSSETGDDVVAEDPVNEEEQMTDDMGDRLSELYVDLMSGDEYLMKYRTTMDMEGQAFEIEATLAVSGDNTAIMTVANGMESTMIMKENESYVVDHENKMVLVMPEVPDAGDSSFDETTGIVNIDDDMSYLGNGKEGNLVYEEYATMDGSVRYYFDGDTFVKMVVDSNGQTMTMEILEFSDKVPDGIFEIPSDYQMITM
jgi:outer membrane lipoprotein-sorting protein